MGYVACFSRETRLPTAVCTCRPEHGYFRVPLILDVPSGLLGSNYVHRGDGSTAFVRLHWTSGLSVYVSSPSAFLETQPHPVIFETEQ
jgi:hypothetical protein